MYYVLYYKYYFILDFIIILYIDIIPII